MPGVSFKDRQDEVTTGSSGGKSVIFITENLTLIRKQSNDKRSLCCRERYILKSQNIVSHSLTMQFSILPLPR